ncbi:MAG: C45 family peptidase [bacterium]
MTSEKPSNTVKLFRFSGTHEEMGHQQGRETARVIKRARDLMAGSEELTLIKPSFIPFGLFVLLGEAKTSLQFGRHIKKYYPQQFKRMAGIARGAGVRPGFIALLQSLEVELNKVDFHMSACSATGVCGKRSAGGEPVIIKNFDYPGHFTEQYVTRLDSPRGRYRVLSVSAAPLAGNHDGINEHGLAIAYNYGYGRDRPMHNVPITIVVQEALETCRTTGEAVEFISRSRRRGGALLMVCDAGGDLRTMEVSNRQVGERMPDNGLLINTNHYLTKEMAAIDIPKGAVFTNRNVKALRGIEVRLSSEARYDRAAELLEKHDAIGDETLMEAFRDHGPGGSPSDNTLCRHSDYFNTTCSVVFYPARRSMKVMYGNPCRTEYQEFSIKNE